MSSYRDWIRKIDIEIDYFSAFIKAWIAFNSWYRNELNARSDRDIIEKLKNENNRFKGYIETLLDSNNNTHESSSFKENLQHLQSALVSASIVTQERNGVSRQISFSEIAINNPKAISENDYRTTHYKIERKGQKITTLIHRKGNPVTQYFYFEQEKYEETALDAHSDFQKLTDEQQGQCKFFYKEICPYVVESVLEKDASNNIVFIGERAKVSRGIIEVLYLLRCSLMHGEVTPDCSSSEVYKYAYEILSAVLKKMI